VRARARASTIMRRVGLVARVCQDAETRRRPRDAQCVSTHARVPVVCACVRACVCMCAACACLARRALSGNAADAPAQAYDTTEWDELQKKHGNLEGVELGSDRCEKGRVQDARGISKDGCTADLC